MTSTLGEFKRREADQLSDWEAPRTSEASKQIIHRFTSFDILNECFNEFSALAASVGIDGRALLNKIDCFNGQRINKHTSGKVSLPKKAQNVKTPPVLGTGDVFLFLQMKLFHN